MINITERTNSAMFSYKLYNDTYISYQNNYQDIKKIKSFFHNLGLRVKKYFLSQGF